MSVAVELLVGPTVYWLQFKQHARLDHHENLRLISYCMNSEKFSYFTKYTLSLV
jgi:hypothetical protein